MNTAIRLVEKRREPRRPAHGSVVVQVPGPRPGEIQGRLMDVSASGFRMVYRTGSLEAGQVVEFHYEGASGQARVIWNRIDGASVQTGFLIL